MRAINIILKQENADFSIGYDKWMRESFSEATSVELDEMEKHFYKCLTVENRIVTPKPLNNPNYQPYQGA